MKRYRRHITTLMLLTATLLLAACYNDVLSDGQHVAVDETTAGYYLNLHIVGSKTPGTRATDAEENAVYDGMLVVFEGSSETTATLKTAVVIDQLINNPGNSASVNITQQLATGTHPYSGNRYVLALLNTSTTGFTVSDGTLCHHGTPLTGCTIDEVKAIEIDSVGSIAEHVGLFMSNAPQADGTVMPLVPASCLFDTPEAAVSGSRLTINVERAAARVTVSDETTALADIWLNGRSDVHPTVHRMTWTVNNYQQKCYAVRHAPTPYANWATSVDETPLTFTARDFLLWPQLSHSGDELYIAENTGATETEVIVEVQLKDQNSMLMQECYTFSYDTPDHKLFTSTEQLISFLKSGWSPAQAAGRGLPSEASVVFKHPTVYICDDGTVSMTLVNSDLTAEQQTSLASLANEMAGYLTGFRYGKVYYTYKIKHDDSRNGVVRNNAYNLRLTNESINRIGRNRP